MADEPTKLTLYNYDDPVNGHESLHVASGSEAEAHWRGLGYLPADEMDADALADADVPAEEEAPADVEPEAEVVEEPVEDAADDAEEWPLQSDPADYIASKTDDDGEPLPDLSDAVLERLELARRIVAATEE